MKQLHEFLNELKQIKAGIDIEKEHKPTINWIKSYYKKHKKFPPDKEVYKSISKDHLKEFKDYYTHLKKMEKEAEKQHNK